MNATTINREEVEVARLGEIQDGGMKHVEVKGKEIMVGNWEGRYYAISDRCGHMNGRFSSGTLRGKVVACGLHGARYDITTGEKISDPQMVGLSAMLRQLPLPENVQKAMERQGRLGAEIKTYDVDRYDVIVEGDSVKLIL